MPYLRIHKSKKTVDNEAYILEVFSVDPDPVTRETLSQDDRTARILDEDSLGVRYIKSHTFSYLPGSIGAWPYSDYPSALSAIYQYGIELFLLADAGDAYLRFHKLNPDTREINTYIVFESEQAWTDKVEAKYNILRPFIDEITDFTEESKTLTDQEYNDFVSEIFVDVRNMKENGNGQCRLDWLNRYRL
jgi:hypothetical protein